MLRPVETGILWVVEHLDPENILRLQAHDVLLCRGYVVDEHAYTRSRLGGDGIIRRRDAQLRDLHVE